MSRLDFITIGCLVHIFSDHVNVLTMYDSNGISYSMPRYAVNKLMLWAIRFSSFNYMVEHIHGEVNHWADMLSRWASLEHNMMSAEKMKLHLVMLAPIRPSLTDAFALPRCTDIENVQSKNALRVVGADRVNFG